jgi:hypothetical protein
MLLISAGIAASGMLLLGLQSRSTAGSEKDALLQSPVVGWFLVFVGSFLLVVTLISGFTRPTATDSTAASTHQPTVILLPTNPPTPRSTATATPTQLPTPVPTPVLEPGWSLRERPEDGFAIALPDNWVEMNLDAASIDEALVPITLCCPEMDLSLWEGQTMADLWRSGLELFAVDPDSDPESVYYGVVIVSRTSLGEGWTLDMALEVVLGEYGDDESKLTHRRVILPAGEAEEILFTDRGDPPMRRIKYLLVQYDAFWFITLGCEAELANDYASIFETIPQTFHWIQAPTR